MSYNNGLGIALFLILSGCGGKRKLREERKAIDRTAARTGYPMHRPFAHQEIPEEISSLTRATAVGMALRKNASLQASFEQLGVAQADLEKAGLFANPYLDAIFTMPHDKILNDKLTETSLTFYFGILKVSDLWLVPIKKRMAEDELEIVSWETTTKALDTIRETQIAYDTCLHAQQQLRAAEQYDVLYQDAISTFTEHIPATYQVIAYRAKTELIKKRAQSRIALIHLQQLISGAPLYQTTLTDTLIVPHEDDYARLMSQERSSDLVRHPSVLIAQTRIERARHQLAFEQGRCVEDTLIGYNYFRDFTGIAGGGPYFRMAFPLGDPTHAGISRSRSLIAQRQREADGAYLLMKERVDQLKEKISTLHEQIFLAQKTLKPLLEEQVAIAYEIFKKKPHKSSGYFTAITTAYEAEQAFLDLLLSYAETLANYDHALGGARKEQNACTQ